MSNNAASAGRLQSHSCLPIYRVLKDQTRLLSLRLGSLVSSTKYYRLCASRVIAYRYTFLGADVRQEAAPRSPRPTRVRHRCCCAPQGAATIVEPLSCTAQPDRPVRLASARWSHFVAGVRMQGMREGRCVYAVTYQQDAGPLVCACARTYLGGPTIPCAVHQQSICAPSLNVLPHRLASAIAALRTIPPSAAVAEPPSTGHAVHVQGNAGC